MKHTLFTISPLALGCALFASISGAVEPTDPSSVPVTIDIDFQDEGKPISPLLMGIFFEDLNRAADGGLYAELIQNRSFEFSAQIQPEWNALSFWKTYTSEGGDAWIKVEGAMPLNARNPQYLVLDVRDPGRAGAGVENEGFDGFPVVEGEEFRFSVYARQIFIGSRWQDGWKPIEQNTSMVVQLVDDTGALVAEAPFEVEGKDWKSYEMELVPSASVHSASFRLISTTKGAVALDMVSLFPKKTYKGRKNGLREDLAETIAALKPRFVRFPGGCLVHGNGLSNMYRWKDTVGPVETRIGQSNLWGYYQSVGLGYYEYFQYCEDIGAIPLPVVPAAVCCQHSGYTCGQGQRGLPMEEMPAFIQDIMDLIEWANGPADSEWGSVRASAGHPEPFGLKYLGVGNEDVINSDFEERFTMIYEALKKAHPEIIVVGTAGPFPDGEDYEKGWELGRKLEVPVLDEHCYKAPDWYWDQLERWDAYNRNDPKVYLGEWAAHDEGRRRTLRSALAEAAYLTAIERNADHVIMASYAPLLAKQGNTQWNPDLIYYDNHEVLLTASYHVQRLWGQHAGDHYLSSDLEQPTGVERVVFSTVKDEQSGDVILKLVNGSEENCEIQLNLRNLGQQEVIAQMETLAAPSLDSENTFENPHAVVPEVKELSVKNGSVVPLERFSCKVIRIPGK